MYLITCISKAEWDYPLPPVLFVQDVISEMLTPSVGETPRDIMVYSSTETTLVFGKGSNVEVIMTRMCLTTAWVGPPVTPATAEEIGRGREEQQPQY